LSEVVGVIVLLCVVSGAAQVSRAQCNAAEVRCRLPRRRRRRSDTDSSWTRGDAGQGKHQCRRASVSLTISVVLGCGN